MPQTHTVTFVEAKGPRPPEAMTRLLAVLAEQGIEARLMRGTVQQDTWLMVAEADLDQVPGRVRECLAGLDAETHIWSFAEVDVDGSEA